jgi:hypothetical protein
LDAEQGNKSTFHKQYCVHQQWIKRQHKETVVYNNLLPKASHVGMNDIDIGK